MERDPNVFTYVYSCDLRNEVKIKIGSLDGNREKPSALQVLRNPLLRYSGLCVEGCSDLYVECKLYSGSRLLSLSVRTAYKAFTTRWNWNEWLTLPIRYCDVPRDAVLVLTIFDIAAPRQPIAVGGTSVSLFSEHGEFMQGMHDLKVWPGKIGHPLHTPGKTTLVPKQGEDGERMQHLAELVKQHHNGQMIKVDWLDRLVFREIEIINEREKRSSAFMYLIIEFQRVDKDAKPLSLIWWEKGADELASSLNRKNTWCDPEIFKENLQEKKHHILARSLRYGIGEKDQKPNTDIRNLLQAVIEYPSTKLLSCDEQDTVFKYRAYLSSSKKALTKFLKCVNWNIESEVKEALDILYKWQPVDADDALELLGPTFSHPEVRKYAVERLSQASDDDLLLYLLQLVQALKYDKWDNSVINVFDVSHYSLESETSADGAIGSGPDHVPEYTASCLGELALNSPDTEPVSVEKQSSHLLPGNLSDEGNLLEPLAEQSQAYLAKFLIQRACNNPILANYFYWYLVVETEEQVEQGLKPDSKTREMYLWVLKAFKTCLQQGSPKSRATWQALTRQHNLIENLVNLVTNLKSEGGNRTRRIEKLKSLLREQEGGFNFASFDPMPFPMDPMVLVKGICSDDAMLFKSVLEPCRLTLLTTTAPYIAIFKYGDDLRQDQLIIQIITLMDKLLRRENLDLKLTPYKVLATSTKHGFVQFVESQSVAEVLRSEGTIQNFFRKWGRCETAPYEISPVVLDNYIKSCAGYCVITYLLGIGDRHLDNLLLTKEGNLFHIDFGYILGQDPKPLPPPMKLSKEMVEGMGGTGSENFNKFRKLCYTAYHQLRRHANLVLNLFSLMVDASVPDIAMEPDKTVKKVEDRFCLHLSDEEAFKHMQELIDASVTAVVAAVVEQIHKIAQYMRK